MNKTSPGSLSGACFSLFYIDFSFFNVFVVSMLSFRAEGIAQSREICRKIMPTHYIVCLID